MIFEKLKRFYVVFDSSECDAPPVFSKGDTVTGRVVLELAGESEIGSLKLQAQGLANVRWTETWTAGSSSAYTQTYGDQVEYLNLHEALLQTGRSIQTLLGTPRILLTNEGDAKKTTKKVVGFAWMCAFAY